MGRKHFVLVGVVLSGFGFLSSPKAQTFDSNAQSITVVQPNGNEVWQVGSVQEIKWTSTDFTDPVGIEYSTDGGASYTSIVITTENDGSLLWTIPNTPSTICAIKVWDAADHDPWDISDAVFTITTAATPTITVTSPNGGEVWPAGSEHEIKWTSSDLSNPVKINYSVDGGASYGEVVNATENDGSYLWTIPYTPSDQCVVLIEDATDGDPFDMSDSHFAISVAQTESIEVISPNGGENLEAGSSYEIQWLSNTAGGSVLIEYSTDSGTSFVPVDNMIFTLDDSSHSWTVPNTPSTNCLIRISDYPDGDPFDESDAEFTIASGTTGGALTVTNTDDSGSGSLRYAIAQANNHAGMDTIFFNIPKGVPGYDTDIGVWTIAPDSALPFIVNGGILLDGFSQMEFIGEDSNPSGPEIQLDGSNAGVAAALAVFASGTEIRGLTINRFKSIGIDFNGVTGGMIAGCYIGTDFAGADSAGNYDGIELRNHTSGVVVEGNVISGNSRMGIFIADSSSNNIIIGNMIGLARDGVTVVGNLSQGINIERRCDGNEIYDNRIGGNYIGVAIIQSSANVLRNNLIGTDETWEMDFGNTNSGVHISGFSQGNIVEENLIGHNGGNGIYISGQDAIHNRLSRNFISGNTLSGIDNVDGGNGELAPPVLSSVQQTQVAGTAGTGQTIELFVDENDEGRFFLGTATSDAAGNFSFTTFEPIPPELYVTATARDTSGNTSEFCPPVNATAVEDLPAASVPAEFSLSQNYPNPFNPATTISFGLPVASRVSIAIHNITGQVVRQILDGKKLAGYHSVVWNASGISSGIYFIKLRAGGFVQTKKSLLLK